ncbi:all-trans retinoic acid-induced differentiation factor isoform X2 [Sceloporus undulatus]|uniref:all-trans retinoic acid-induced differentiation factor isoform X2 n=1 Tax=Sceloporus undulatus TaxID=8520 RepID=UPI001C4D627A|nr:all-trans retinoic acid-induced differentiation factor isoform X2 [Sceloporus undulatus]
MILRFSLFWDKRLPFQRTPLGGGKGARPAVARLPWRPRDAEGRAVLRHVTGHVSTKMAAPSWPFSSGAPSLLLAFLAAFLAGASPGALGSGGPERERASAWLCEGECCAGPARKGSAVAAFCSGRGPGAALRGRCCLEGQAAMIVGLDLGNCSLQRLCSSFQEASTAIVIDLSDNPLEPLPTEAFRGFSHLETLVLPLKLDCPGGKEGWNNTSVRGNSRVCQGQRNPCDGSAGLGHLPLPALLWDFGSCHCHPLRPALDHPAEEGQGILVQTDPSVSGTGQGAVGQPLVCHV